MLTTGLQPCGSCDLCHVPLTKFARLHVTSCSRLSTCDYLGHFEDGRGWRDTHMDVYMYMCVQMVLWSYKRCSWQLQLFGQLNGGAAAAAAAAAFLCCWSRAMQHKAELLWCPWKICNVKA